MTTTKIRISMLELFKQGKYQTTTTYSKELNKENKIGIANITIHEHDDIDKKNISISIAHSGENNHYEKVCFHFNGSEILKVHTSNLTTASHQGTKLYFSNNKKLVSAGKGFSHIHKCYVEYKKYYSSDGDDIIVKLYTKKNKDFFSLQSTTRLIPYKLN